MAGARELVRRAAEGVGGDDIASGFQVGRMHGSHFIRMGKVPNIRRFTRREACALQHGAHRAVKKSNCRSSRFSNFIFAVPFGSCR